MEVVWISKEEVRSIEPCYLFILVFSFIIHPHEIGWVIWSISNPRRWAQNTEIFETLSISPNIPSVIFCWNLVIYNKIITIRVLSWWNLELSKIVISLNYRISSVVLLIAELCSLLYLE
jgi:hypothetical protein